MGLSPQPSQTAEQHQASEQKETEKRTHSLQQEDSPTRPSACPTATLKRQVALTNYTTMCAILQRTCTSYSELNATHYSASQSSQTPTMSQFFTRMKSNLKCQHNNNHRIPRHNSPRLAMQKYKPMANPPHQTCHQREHQHSPMQSVPGRIST